MNAKFLSSVYNENLVAAEYFFQSGIQFKLSNLFIKSLITDGKLDAILFLENIRLINFEWVYIIYAVESNNIDMVKHYINSDNIHIITLDMYKIAVYIARKNRNQKIIQYLENPN